MNIKKMTYTLESGDTRPLWRKIQFRLYYIWTSLPWTKGRWSTGYQPEFILADVDEEYFNEFKNFLESWSYTIGYSERVDENGNVVRTYHE